MVEKAMRPAHVEVKYEEEPFDEASSESSHGAVSEFNPDSEGESSVVTSTTKSQAASSIESTPERSKRGKLTVQFMLHMW